MDISIVVKEFQNGSKEAFGILYNTYSRPMMKVIDYYVHDHDVAQDILHDGFIVAFTSINSLKDIKKFESWLTTIMKNLSLQYLRTEAEHISIPMSDTAISEQLADYQDQTDLTWEQLESIIRKLPDGYGLVFRLNVLHGLSHKEISKLLGISHLTSASQLHHAKAMLRRMIYQYRMEMCIISIVIAFVIYKSIIYRHIQDEIASSDCENTLGNTTIAESLKNTLSSEKFQSNVSGISVVRKQNRLESDKNIACIEMQKESALISTNDSLCQDSVVETPRIPDTQILISRNDQENTIHSYDKDIWAFSLACSGTMGHANNTNYRIPDISSGIPGQDMEESRSVRHYVPVSIGFSVSKNLSRKWSVTSGLRYTYLRTDILTENKYNNMETINKFHYVGIPLKLNYKAFQTNRFTIYGQTGIVFNMPVSGTSYVSDYRYNESTPIVDKTNLNMPVQWSIESGLGIQYQFTPTIGIYAEPSFNYYFNSGSEINIIWQDRPFDFTIPIGVRMTL